LVSCQRNSTIFSIWRFSLKNPSHPERVAQGGVDVIMPTAGRKTSRIAWVYQLWDLNVYRVSTKGDKPPEKLIASTLRDQNPVYSADGRIAWISDRSGSREIWIARGDGAGETQVTNFNGPHMDHLEWSPDGRTLVFDSRPRGVSDIFTMECSPSAPRCGEPKRIDAATAGEAPTWSADGKSFYFASHQTGQAEIWKTPVAGGQPVQITRHGGYMGRESADGKWLYYTTDRAESLWRIPTNISDANASPAAEMVIGPPYRVQAEGWCLTPDEIFFIDRPTAKHSAAIRAWRIATRQTRLVLDLTEVFPDRGDIGLSISRDARWILFPQLDRSGSNVIVADNFR
jgi:dipeptidyl aminopeptidase/acylaminoacyl peptidase